MTALSSRFRGASAEAVAALREKLNADVTGAEQADRVGADLFAVADSLRREASLRRFVTDASVDAEARAGVVSDLFGEKVAPEALALFTDAVKRRWVAGRDLPAALAQLSVVARVTASEDPVRLSDELFTVARAVKTTPELRDALADRSRSVEDRASLVASLLDGKALPATAALASQAIRAPYRTVGAALDEYAELITEARGERMATVRVAAPLGDAEVRRLEAALTEQYGRTVHLHVITDPDVLGGIRVEIGDDVIDGTVSSRLDDARRRIAG